MSRAFTLASSRWPPKPESVADDVQPTAPCVSDALRDVVGAWCFPVRLGEVCFRTSREESVF
jgi:hypothetical protein